MISKFSRKIRDKWSCGYISFVIWLNELLLMRLQNLLLFSKNLHVRAKTLQMDRSNLMQSLKERISKLKFWLF